MDRRKDNLVTLAVVAAIAILVAVVFLGPRLQSATAGETSTRTSSTLDSPSAASSESSSSGEDASAVRFSDGPFISLDDLPDEAIDTLLLIDADGPFPYPKDGTTFQNREGLLPDHDSGYYREYTVDTPGLDHRGARRIVGGQAGDLWYTSDHYESFREIVGW